MYFAGISVYSTYYLLRGCRSRECSKFHHNRHTDYYLSISSTPGPSILLGDWYYAQKECDACINFLNYHIIYIGCWSTSLDFTKIILTHCRYIYRYLIWVGLAFLIMFLCWYGDLVTLVPRSIFSEWNATQYWSYFRDGNFLLRIILSSRAYAVVCEILRCRVVVPGWVLVRFYGFMHRLRS